MAGGINTYPYATLNPLRWIDALGLCAMSPDMQACLNEVFGADTEFVGVYENTWWIRLFPGWVDATTLPGEIHVRDCSSFLGSPWLVLDEYFHVMRQWGPHGEMGPFDYLWECRRGHRGCRFEDEANDFASKNLDRFEDCLNECTDEQ